MTIEEQDSEWRARAAEREWERQALAAYEKIEQLRTALGAIAAKNDLSAVADADPDTQRSAAFAALHDCEIIAREALGD